MLFVDIRWQIVPGFNSTLSWITQGQISVCQCSPVAGQQFEYGFDDIGNRKVARRGGDENGWNLRQSIYTANLLNQYTQRTVPGFVDIIGVALATNPVYVKWTDGQSEGRVFPAGAECEQRIRTSVATGDSDGEWGDASYR